MDIRKLIAQALVEATSFTEIQIDVPENDAFGDFSTNIALILPSQSEAYKDGKPREVAEALVQKLKENEGLDRYIEKIEIAGPGFINFYLKSGVLVENVNDIVKKGAEYGRNNSFSGKKVIVEYSSPNIAKPFTIGHLRSTIIGDAVANLMDATGWSVLRDNHLGDWGTQFGKQIYAIKTWGNEEKIAKSERPVKELVELYIKFHEEAEKNPELNDKAREWFKKLEDGDSEARRIWEDCIKWSWEEFFRIYETLGVHFSPEFDGGKGLGESYFEDKMDDVVKELEEKRLLKEGKEGAKLVFFPSDKYPPAMILKKDGTTLYHTRDLAADKYRKEKYNPDMIINEVGNEQMLYFQQLFEIEQMLGWFEKEQRKHISHGLYRFEGRKMATRKGDVIWLEDVLAEAVKRAKTLGSESDVLAKQVGIGAIKWNDLKRDAKSDIVFNWDELLAMEGNSGPYMQYTYARTESVLVKAGGNTNNEVPNMDKIVPNEEERLVLQSLYRYSGTVSLAAQNYTPNTLCNYLYDLAQKYNAFYNKHRILEDDGKSINQFRLVLTEATGIVIKNGLGLLGIEAPESM